MSLSRTQSIEDFNLVPTLKPKETYEYPSPLQLRQAQADESILDFVLSPIDERERADLPMKIKSNKSRSILYVLINKKKVLASL